MSKPISLKPGQLVTYKGECWRVVEAPDFQRVLAARVSDGRLDFLTIEDLGVSDSDVQGARNIRVLPAGDVLNESQMAAAKRIVGEYRDLVNLFNAPRINRRELMQSLCRKYGYNEATAYRRMKLAKEFQTPDVLLRAVRSDKGGKRLLPEVQTVIREHLAKHRYIPEPKTIPDVLELVNGALRKQGLREISKTTLSVYDKDMPLKKKLEAQGRKKAAADAFRTKAGHLPNADYPLAIIQVDHTPIQVCLVDEQDRMPINDAWLTLVVECYSRMVLGFFLTFDAPSTLSTGMALAHAFLPKEEFLRSVGVSGEWPCWGIPDVILVDNAAELNGLMMHGARRRYSFTLRDRPVGAPNFGGHVESAFRTFMNEFKGIPGTKFSNPLERGEYDSEGRAILTISEFQTLFTEFLVNDYHLNDHSGEGMNGSVPLLKWKQGIFEGDAMPPTGLPDRPADSLALRISLMPFKRRTVRNGTIQLFDETYHSGALTLIGDKVDLSQSIDQRLFEVRYDPRNISKVWLYYQPNDNYIEVPFADLRKGPISLWEWEAQKRRRTKLAEQFKDVRYESKLRREEIKESAAKKTKRQRLEREKARLRAEGALVQPQKPTVKPAAPPSSKSKLDPERLRAMRDKVRAAEPNRSARNGSDDET